MKTRITTEYLEKALRENNLPFESFNRGMHYRINNKCDFWPSTSRYSFLKGQLSGNGLEEMLNLLINGTCVRIETKKIETLDNKQSEFLELTHTDIDTLDNAELRRIIIYLTKKLMEAETKLSETSETSVPW